MELGSKYRQELKNAMEMLAKDERVLFIGQTVAYPGSRFTYGTLENIAMSKRIELPIMEEVQMGLSTGLSLEGYIPVSIYPRFDFVLLATNQLVNHLDKIEEMSEGQFKPKIIMRTVIGSKEPLYPGPQHCQDYTDSLKLMLKNIDVIKLEKSEEIVPAYLKALNNNRSSLLIEQGDLHYNI